MTDSLSVEDINESESAEAEDVSNSNQNEAAIVEANMMQEDTNIVSDDEDESSVSTKSVSDDFFLSEKT